jgi:hypothetical protein
MKTISLFRGAKERSLRGYNHKRGFVDLLTSNLLAIRSKTMKAKIFFAGLLFAVLFLASSSYSQVPPMINFQGVVNDAAGNPLDGDFDMIFSIWDAPVGGNELWAEAQNLVPVENGVFNVLLGNVNPIPFDVFNGDIRFLEVAIAGDPPMDPRQAIVSVPYAFRSVFADNDWVIDGDNIYHEQGNVGIGTMNPTSRLEVNGNVEADGFTINGVPVGTSTDSYWTASDGDIYYNSGFVSIGAPWGFAPLTVRGDPRGEFVLAVATSDFVPRETGSFMLMGFMDRDGNTPAQIQVADQTGFGDLILLQYGGNVGIGMSTTDQLEFGGGERVLGLRNAIINPTDPVPGAALFYVSGGEMFVYDAAGNASLLSPHDKETGEWIFYSKNTKTGRVVRVDMERLVRKVEELTGEKFMIESWEEEN